MRVLNTCNTIVALSIRSHQPSSGNNRGSVVTTSTSSSSAGQQADANWAARAIADVEAKLPSICDGVQNRLAGGTSVRDSFKAEVRAQCGVELIGADVKVMVTGIAKIGAFFKSRRRLSCHRKVVGRNLGRHYTSPSFTPETQKRMTYVERHGISSTATKTNGTHIEQLIQTITEVCEDHRNLGGEMDIDVRE